MWDLWENVLHGFLSKGPRPYLREVLEINTENSERLGRQAQPRIKPSTSRLRVRVQNRSATDGPTEMELMLSNLDCDFLNPTDIALEIDPEEELVDSSLKKKVHWATIVSYCVNLNMDTSSEMYTLDSTFKVATC